jgi:hypothetical protein
MDKILVHNIATGEIIERNMTQTEIAQRNALAEETEITKTKELRAQEAKAAAEAKLAALGLTSDDLKALGL